MRGAVKAALSALLACSLISAPIPVYASRLRNDIFIGNVKSEKAAARRDADSGTAWHGGDVFEGCGDNKEAARRGANNVPSWHGGDVFAGCRDNKVAALTFDDGPHPHQTDEILAILAKYGVKATFFEIGCNVRLYPEVTSRVIAAGHEIGNHTDSHSFLHGFSRERVADEVMSADDAIYDAAEYETHFLRPPGGIYDNAVVDAATDGEKVIALWTIDTEDWSHKSRDSIVKTVLNKVKGGDIILMHDYVSGEAHTAEALEVIIPELLRRGFSLVTLSDMYLNHRGG